MWYAELAVRPGAPGSVEAELVAACGASSRGVALVDAPAAWPGSSRAARAGPAGRPRARRRGRTRSRCPSRCTCRPGRAGTPAGWCPCRRAPGPGRRRAASLRSRAPPSPQMKFLVSWKLCAANRPRLPSGSPAPGAEEAVRVVLDQRDVGPVGEHPADALHVAGDAGVVDHHDRAHGVVEQRREVLRVEAERARLDVAEQQPCALPGERERRGRERERRHDDGVTRVRGRAASRTARAPPCTRWSAAPPRRRSRSASSSAARAANSPPDGGVAALDRLLDVLQLAALDRALLNGMLGSSGCSCWSVKVTPRSRAVPAARAAAVRDDGSAPGRWSSKYVAHGARRRSSGSDGIGSAALVELLPGRPAGSPGRRRGAA